MTSYILSQMLRSKQALDPPCFHVDQKQIKTTISIYRDVKAFSDIEVNFQYIFFNVDLPCNKYWISTFALVSI